MGYYPFDLKILQLVAPTSNMTKVEYANVYGINLDKVDFKSFKLIEFNGEKYAVDQIKAVEGGYELYFNGRILSITDTVQTSNEVYDVANSKPIYCHPIAIVSTGASKIYRITCLIFNNSPTPFTLATFKGFIDNLYSEVGDTIRIMVSGAYNNVGEQQIIIASYLSRGSGTYGLVGLGTDGTVSGANASTLEELFPSAQTTFVDGVNKIN